MSVEQVQSRMSQIEARMQALTGGTTAGVAGGVVGQASFAGSLAEVQSSTAPVAVTTASTVAPTTATGTAARAVALAQKQIGTPYVFGGEAPGGFDCSGLMQWTYAQLGVTLPRRAVDQGNAGTPVPPADARAGDLVYFDRPGSVDHIGMYNGDGTWTVAPRTGAQVRIEPVDLAKATSIRRVTGDAPTPSAAGSWAATLPPGGKRWSGMLQQAADAAGVDPRLLSAVAWTESGFNPTAESGAGAQGLMQLMPRTAQGLGVDPLDPSQALSGGARYLREQLDAFGGRPDLALAAYNAGPTAVRKHGGIPPYAETQAYVTRVLDRYRQLGGTS